MSRTVDEEETVSLANAALGGDGGTSPVGWHIRPTLEFPTGVVLTSMHNASKYQRQKSKNKQRPRAKSS